MAGLSTAALLTACGDGTQQDRQGGLGQQTAFTHDQYQKAIWDIRGGDPSSRASRLFFEVVGNLSKQDCSDKSHSLHDQLAALVRQIEGLHPPTEAEAAQRAFVEAANESVRLVGVAADDVDAGELTCGTAMNQRIYDMPSTRRAEKAIEELEKLDYNVLGD